MSSLRPPYLISSSGVITIFLKGKPYSVDDSHPNYEAVKSAIKAGQFDGLLDLIDVSTTIKRSFAANTSAVGTGVEVKDGQIFYDGEVVHNAVADKILQFIREGFDFAPLVKFLNNLLENPSKASLDNLYRFLDHNQHPITEDGCFLAYKGVTNDYKDYHSGTVCNKVGNVVKIARNKVQDDPSVTCSYGLHVASLSYAKSMYGGQKMIVCKVNPKDVVSVPTDYNNTKMRVCEYTVVSDFVNEVKQEEVVGKAPQRQYGESVDSYGNIIMTPVGSDYADSGEDILEPTKMIDYGYNESSNDGLEERTFIDEDEDDYDDDDYGDDDDDDFNDDDDDDF